MKRHFVVAKLLVAVYVVFGCQPEKRIYKILGNIEDPQNEIAKTIASLWTTHLEEEVEVVPGIGSLANLDSLEKGSADFGIVDNYAKYNDKISTLLPLYPQVLHILHKRDVSPCSFKELLGQGKIYAGIEGSGTRRFVNQLIVDLGLEKAQIDFVDVLNLFDANVILAFTDLLSQEELRDLKEYKLYSMDQVENLGKGSIADGICARYPQFEPYVIAKHLYGDFTEIPILTVKVDALLVCRAGVSPELAYDVTRILIEHSQDLKRINPLLFNVSLDIDPRKFNFSMHPGARDFIERNQPGFLEKYAEVLSVIISVFVALASGLYTLSRWQKAKKKNKIDVYYNKLIELRGRNLSANSLTELEQLEESLKHVQEDTIHLVVEEKLLADESFSIFLNLSKIVMDEIKQKEVKILSVHPDKHYQP